MRAMLDANKAEILNEMRKMQDILSLLQVKMNGVEDNLVKIAEAQKKQEREIKCLKEEVQMIKDDHANIMTEIEDRDRRKPNLIISGFPEMENGSDEEHKTWDAEKMETLFSDLCNFNNAVISSIHRIGNLKSQRPRLLKVVCRDEDSKRSLLHKAKNLRTMSRYNRVYLNPDLTTT